MKKDTLTLENIKKDLNSIKRGGYMFIQLLIVLIIPCIIVAYHAFKEGGAAGFASLELWLLIILMVVLIFLTVRQLIKIKMMLATELLIVTDKLVGKNLQYEYRQIQPTRYLYFSGYGEYIIPRGINYEWSEYFAMSDERVYDRADPDDEFYIVLDQKHTGKILAVYSCKLFALEETKG